jgi:SAM-dependent methyltransferase
MVSRFYIGADCRVADFGCGPGLYATRLARRQASVTGIDFSKRSIDYAQKVAAGEGLNIRYVNQNYLDFETDERFDLIMMIMCDFCALSPGQRKTLLEKFCKMLKPKGSVLLDVYSLVSFQQREETAIFEPNLLDGFWAPGRYYGFLNIFKYDEDNVILDKYTIIEPNRTRTVYNWLQYFTPEEIKREFSECGLKVGELYSDVAGAPYDRKSEEFAVVAKKL